MEEYEECNDSTDHWESAYIVRKQGGNIHLIPGWLKKNSRNVGPVSTGTATVVGVVGLVPGVAAVPSTAGVAGTGAGRILDGAGGVTRSGAWIACNIKQ